MEKLLGRLCAIVANNQGLGGSRRPNSPLDVSSQWQVLGPFQIGTREATWGADPLEYHGGFSSLTYDQSSTYPSSLGINGTVGWSLQAAELLSKTPLSVQASLKIEFSDFNWKFLQSIYGWAALQYQAWARGEIVIHSDVPHTIVFYTDNILEFSIDNKRYFGGDFYTYRRAPLVLQLCPGMHTVDIRLIRDVRAMGGVGAPTTTIRIEAILSNESLFVDEDKILLPEMVNRTLPSHVGSVPIRNEREEWVDVIGIHCTVKDTFEVSLLKPLPWALAPGQTRPLSFRITQLNACSTLLALKISYQIRGSLHLYYSVIFTSSLVEKAIHEPHKMTFLHPSGIVSYAILRAPKSSSLETAERSKLPILMNLHGAGLEADSDQVRHMLDSAGDIRAWVIFPTGVTSWSGDDWHTWGYADIEAVVAAIPSWIETVDWKGPGVALEQWYVSGHSNGGQGAWFVLCHQPDKVMAAAPVSGYSSIQAYVPYLFWNATDPGIMANIHSSLVSYQHELLVDNFAGIPILQQHGSEDDNVPAFHSRRLKQLIYRSGWTSNYVELTGQGHWFKGIMTTVPMCEFYEKISEVNGTLPELPDEFSIVVPNSGDMGPRGGVFVDQLASPDQLGKISVVRNNTLSKWTLKTSNIHRFHLLRHPTMGKQPESLEVDDMVLTNPLHNDESKSHWVVRDPDGNWSISYDQAWRCIGQRYGAQLGALDSVMRSNDRFAIQYHDSLTHETALQISRNLFQYFAADCELVCIADVMQSFKGNIISVVHGLSLPEAYPNYALRIDSGSGVYIRDAAGRQRHYPPVEGLGAIYIQPLPDERLQLVIWGFDEAGLLYASRLVPMLTGVGQTDFIVVSTKCLWTGAGGVVAMGFFDHDWNVSHASYLR